MFAMEVNKCLEQPDTRTEALKKKEKIRNVVQKLLKKKERNAGLVKNLQRDIGKIKKKVADKTEKFSTLLGDIRRQLDHLGKKVQREIFKQEEQAILPYMEVIQYLETKNDELSRKTHDLELTCDLTDADLPGLLESEPDVDDFWLNEDKEMFKKVGWTYPDQSVIDQFAVLDVLHAGWTEIKKDVDDYFRVPELANLSLDVTTAGYNLYVFDDLQMVSGTHKRPNIPECPTSFMGLPQVLSRETLSTGRHYWDVEILTGDIWAIGMCYPTMIRAGPESLIGFNNKSWCLMKSPKSYQIYHDFRTYPLFNVCGKKFRVYLDYEGGELSFYELGDPIRHLYTFTATFTEPLHAALYLDQSCMKIQDPTPRGHQSSCTVS